MTLILLYSLALQDLVVLDKYLYNEVMLKEFFFCIIFTDLEILFVLFIPVLITIGSLNFVKYFIK